MEFWLFAACLTIAATLVVLLPLTRGKQSRVSGDHNDIEVYRDQMREIDADAERGMIDRQSAEQARLEIARRMLLSEKKAAKTSTKSAGSSAMRVFSLIAVLSVPLLSWSLYSAFGSPELPSQPFAARMAVSPERSSVDELVARAEAHLAESPTDGRGWDVLAPIYLRLGRTGDAVNAFRAAIRLQGENFSRVLGLGEALTASAGGTVTAEAQALFEKARDLDPADVRPQYYLARGLMQDNRVADAADMLEAFLEKAPANAPWREQLVQAIAQIKTRATRAPAVKGPTAQDVENAAGLNDTDRSAMIETMVSGLNERLKTNPDDVAGWQRLVRSYAIMNRRDDAVAALQRGVEALSAEKGQQLTSFANELGIAAGEAPKGDVKP